MKSILTKVAVFLKISPQTLVIIILSLLVLAMIGTSFLITSSTKKTVPATIIKTPPSLPQSNKIQTEATNSVATFKEAVLNVSPAVSQGYLYTNAEVISFNPATKILLLTAANKPEWKVTINGVIKIYEADGHGKIDLIQPNKLAKGWLVTVQADPKSGEILQINATKPPSGK